VVGIFPAYPCLEQNRERCLSLIFGLMSVINLVHGSYYMLGAYLGLVIIRQTDRS
jgi:hypothetical protein